MNKYKSLHDIPHLTPSDVSDLLKHEWALRELHRRRINRNKRKYYIWFGLILLAAITCDYFNNTGFIKELIYNFGLFGYGFCFSGSILSAVTLFIDYINTKIDAGKELDIYSKLKLYRINYYDVNSQEWWLE